MVSRTPIRRKKNSTHPFQQTPPAPTRGGQASPAYPREVPLAFFEQHASDCEAHARRVVALHPEADLSPLSIRADQARLGNRCKAIEAQQAKLREALALEDLAFWEIEPDEAWMDWDLTVNNL